MALRRGIRSAIAERTCEPCRQRRHTECLQESSVKKLGEIRELRKQGFNEPEPSVPYCECYSTTDLHL